ncbi:MAG: ATP-binding cassette domain-containing protein [Thermoguttaceae bacterium]|jgi:putative ABC transport system ATP-binding protein
MSQTFAFPAAAGPPIADNGASRAALRARGLNHYFGEGELRKQVLFDNNLEVARGEIVIMTGPSGSGKTTLLTLIGGLRTVQEGSLEVLGHQLRDANLAKLVSVRRELGFIFQAHNLFQSLTAFQNVRMAAELFASFTPQQAQQRITELLTILGLGHRIHYKPDSLSGGQKQRVAVARALVHRPPLILADEPTAALDEKSGRDVVTLFQKFTREEQCTIIMVTHDNRILDVADRIVSMVDGQIKSNVLVRVAAQICEFLRNVPLFQRLTPKTLSEVADKVRQEKHPAGTAIVAQGDVGDKFYLIRRGSVEVRRTEKEGAESRLLTTLGEGQFFGETALITGETRNATVVAREETEFYTLGKEDFQAVIQASATFEEELRKAIFQRQ